jgi:hypothetical protein
MTLSMTAGLLCEQIRLENNGKLFAIGIYSGSITVPAFPYVGMFQLLTQVQSDQTGLQSLRLRVCVLGIETQTAEGELEAVRTGKEWIPIGLQPIQFLVPGPMTIDYADATGAWVEFFRIMIERPAPA